jgi:20S proteasome subunit alpha 6
VYGSALQTERLVADVADKHQRATQSYVRRPYGVGLLVAGYDRTGPHLFQTCPSGNYYEWKGMALGARSQSAKTYLEKNVSAFADAPRDELIRHALRALHGCTEPEKELDTANTVVGIVGVGERFHLLEGDAVAPFLEALAGLPRPAAMELEEEEPDRADEAAPGAAAGSNGAGAAAPAPAP